MALITEAVDVAEIPRRRISASAWDAFAEACGASFRCAHGALWAWPLDRHLAFRLRRFEIFGTDGEKIGQCAVATSRRYATFVDGLQLLPGREPVWRSAMARVLAAIGSKQYRYGSPWSLEPSRASALAGIAGVTLASVEPVVVQAIEFSRWSSWDAYFRQISSNARRNAKRSLRVDPGLQAPIRRGWAALRDGAPLTRMQSDMARRKNLPARPNWILLRFLLRSVAMRKYALTALARSSAGRSLAAFSGIAFGRNTYYLTGGSRHDNRGAAWHLMLTVIRDAYERSGGRGRFLMGTVEDGTTGWSDLARSRDQCRVSDFPTSIVSFCYRAPG